MSIRIAKLFGKDPAQTAKELANKPSPATNYADQIAANTRAFNYGTPEEQKRYAALQEIANQIQNQTGGIWTKDGKNVLDPGVAPGALAHADAAEAAARAQQAGYVGDFTNTTNTAGAQ